MLPIESNPRVTRRLRSLHLELMRIRITEELFFFGKERHPGDVMDVEVGPYRTEVMPGGLRRIPQFVEMPEDTQEPDHPPVTEPTPVVPPKATFADATASILNPTPVVAVAPKANPLAARVRALTARRAKFQDDAAAILGQGESMMTEIEATGPQILQRSVDASHDELTAIKDLGSSLNEMAASNGPLSK